MEPDYLRIADTLRRGIHDQTYGTQLPTEPRLAEQFEVSTPTIKKALSLLVADGLIVRIPGKGTFVKVQADDAAAAPVAKEAAAPVAQPATVGVIVPTVADAFASRMFAGIAAGLAERHIHLLFGASLNDRSKEGEFVNSFVRAGVQGLIVFPVEGELYNEQIVRLSLERFPLVLVDRWLPGIDVSRVVGDHAGGTAQAVGYLQRLGHRRIALASVDSAYPKSTKSILERVRGYSESIKSAGLPADDDLLWIQEAGPGPEHDAAVDFLCAKLRAHPDVTAVIAISIFDAQRVSDAAARLNVRIPGDLSLIGFDLGGPIHGFERLFGKGGDGDPVAWLDQSEYTIGYEAARLVCQLMDDTTTTEAIQVPAVLRPGATCAVPARPAVLKS